MKDHLPPYNSVFHPSDFSKASEIAFCHALKIALAAQGDLTLHHAEGGDHASWQDFPGIRETLERWKLIPEGSERHMVVELGIDVQKVISHESGPVNSVLHFLENHPADLIVLATHAHEGRMSWLRHSKAEPIAREAHIPSLFLPHETPGFVRWEDGAVNLRDILIPVIGEPAPSAALKAALRLTTTLSLPSVNFHLLHVGDQATMPELDLPMRDGLEWSPIVQKGEIVETILEAASAYKADLIVMATAGHHGFLDALRGSTTERVLHGAQCPLLAVPPWR